MSIAARTDTDHLALRIIKTAAHYDINSLVVRKMFRYAILLICFGLGLFALKMPWRRAYRLGGWAWRIWRLLQTVRRFAL